MALLAAAAVMRFRGGKQETTAEQKKRTHQAPCCGTISGSTRTKSGELILRAKISCRNSVKQNVKSVRSNIQRCSTLSPEKRRATPLHVRTLVGVRMCVCHALTRSNFFYDYLVPLPLRDTTLCTTSIIQRTSPSRSFSDAHSHPKPNCPLFI